MVRPPPLRTAEIVVFALLVVICAAFAARAPAALPRPPAAGQVVPPSPPTPPAPAPATTASKGQVESALSTLQTNQQMAALRSQIQLAEKELEFRKHEQDRITQSMNQIQGRLNNLPVREQELAQITRDYQISKDNYRSLLDKRISAEMASDMEHRQQSERFTVLDPARIPEKPIKPKRGMLDAMGCVIGLAVALLLGIGWELKKNLFLGEWELPNEIPILSRLPYIALVAETAPKGPPPLLRRGLIVSSAVVSLAVVAIAAYYLVSHGS